VTHPVRVHARVLHRPVESRGIEDFLVSAAVEPSALVLEGEAGIGKTTIWLEAVEEARRRGTAVLSARPSASEVTLGHASVADLLRAAGPQVIRTLPPPQRLAVSRVLQLADVEGATDQQTIGAAVLSVVEGLAAEGPVLLAVDDAQWLDASSTAVLGFVVRRLTGPVGVLVTVRTEPGDGDRLPWLHLARPESVARLPVRPLPPEALHAVLAERLGRPFPRPVITRIEQISGGNPFYALELGRTVGSPSEALPLSPTLGDLVRGRFDGVGPELRDLLLAVASLGDATVELLQTGYRGTDEGLVADIEDGERQGLLVVEGHRVRFAHPLLAAAVRSDAGPGARRAMHRRLAAIVEDPEQRARHLALAAVRGNPETLDALDQAAVLARARGAPAAAAELLELAIALGGATPQRRLQAALHHFDAGDTERARRDLEGLARELPAGPLRARATSRLGLVRLHDDSFVEAAALLRQSLADGGADLRIRVEILLWLAFAEVNVGRLASALEHVAAAVVDGERLGDPHLIGQALVLRATLRFMRGDGIDWPELERALEMESDTSQVPVAFRPGTQAVLLQAWAGQLDAAVAGLHAIRRVCADHGRENDLVFVDFHSVLVDVWRGDLLAASATAAVSMERALQLNGDVSLAVARSLRGLVATYLGDVEEARRESQGALDIYRRCGWSTLAQWPLATLGLLHVSTGDHHAALATLEPMLGDSSDLATSGEIISSSHLPDAIEALVQLGRLDEAEGLLEPFQRAGRRRDRPWTLATAGRGRAMLLAARGDVEAACAAAEEAMAQHDRLPMPFERARTQLLHGQLLRRRRKKESAAAALDEALRTFERLGTRLWAERARTELGRVGAGLGYGADLTPSEHRVAELAAQGMTNREVAAELFISPKTVEANLARVYRKLDIRSRAELGRLMGPTGS
jgi:DNA-binding CsgD family transcriptional regulator